jgi:hypothetical protein
MISQETYRKVRTTMIVVSLTFGTGVFWAALVAGLVQYIFNSNENQTLLFVGWPVFVLYCIWCVRHLPGILRKAGYIE